VTKRAKNPKTEMTTIAQWGKDEPSLVSCTLPVGLDVVDEFDDPGESVAVGRREEDADMAETIELAYVVSVMAYLR